jgi:hypothetical protein
MAKGLGTMSQAATDLGLGGQLQQQVKDETDEQRRKRLMAQGGSQLSPGAASLLGGSMGLSGGGY